MLPTPSREDPGKETVLTVGSTRPPDPASTASARQSQQTREVSSTHMADMTHTGRCLITPQRHGPCLRHPQAV